MNLILNDAYEVFMLSVFFYVVSFFLIWSLDVMFGPLYLALSNVYRVWLHSA